MDTTLDPFDAHVFPNDMFKTIINFLVMDFEDSLCIDETKNLSLVPGFNPPIYVNLKHVRFVNKKFNAAVETFFFKNYYFKAHKVNTKFDCCRQIQKIISTDAFTLDNIKNFPSVRCIKFYNGADCIISFPNNLQILQQIERVENVSSWATIQYFSSLKQIHLKEKFKDNLVGFISVTKRNEKYLNNFSQIEVFENIYANHLHILKKCPNLKTIQFSNKIDDSVFEYCVNGNFFIEKIILPECLTTIKFGTKFENPKIQISSIPMSIKKIYYGSLNCPVEKSPNRDIEFICYIDYEKRGYVKNKITGVFELPY